MCSTFPAHKIGGNIYLVHEIFSPDPSRKSGFTKQMHLRLITKRTTCHSLVYGVLNMKVMCSC